MWLFLFEMLSDFINNLSLPFFFLDNCKDKISNCADYGYTVCTDPKYTAWTVENCQRTCFKCQIITEIPFFQGKVLDVSSPRVSPAQ